MQQGNVNYLPNFQTGMDFQFQNQKPMLNFQLTYNTKYNGRATQLLTFAYYS